jgi:hypothetical protein
MPLPGRKTPLDSVSRLSLQIGSLMGGADESSMVTARHGGGVMNSSWRSHADSTWLAEAAGLCCSRSPLHVELDP